MGGPCDARTSKARVLGRERWDGLLRSYSDPFWERREKGAVDMCGNRHQTAQIVPQEYSMQGDARHMTAWVIFA